MTNPNPNPNPNPPGRKPPQRLLDAIGDSKARMDGHVEPEEPPALPETAPERPSRPLTRPQPEKVAVYVVAAEAVVVRPREWAEPGAVTDQSPLLRGTIIDTRLVDREHLVHLIAVGLVRRVDVEPGRMLPE